MALLFIDSFDHYDNADDKYLAGGAYIAANGRHGKGWSGTHTLRCALNPTSSRVIVGSAYFFTATGINHIVGLTDQSPDDTNNIALVDVQNDGSIAINMWGGPGVQSASDLVRLNQWHYIECDLTVETVTVSSSTYAYNITPAKVYLDGLLVLDVATVGPSLESTGSPSLYGWRFVDLGFIAGVIDDVYICDGSGPAPHNGPLGDVRIDVIRPNGVGAVTQWTPTGAAANWDAMNDRAPDDEATRVTAATAGLSDLYQMEDINTNDGIIGAQLLINARRTAEGFATLTPLLRHAGVTYPLVTRALTPTYFYRNRDVFVTMPNGDPLTDANVNALQAGLRREA